MTETEQAEIRNFFRAKTDLNNARQNGQPIDEFVEEIDLIVLHTEQAALRTQARRLLHEVHLWKRTTITA